MQKGLKDLETTLGESADLPAVRDGEKLRMVDDEDWRSHGLTLGDMRSVCSLHS